MKRNTSQPSHRRGSTLIIVIALLGLLAFMGMVFYTFAAQEHSASSYFSEAAKSPSLETTPNNAFEWMLQQLIVGPSARLKGSILYSPESRHSMLRNLVGSDVHPFTGSGITVAYDGGGLPVVTSNQAGGENYLNFVDSPVARNGTSSRTVPSPDVDYSYPDINNLFLAYKGWAIRDNSEDLDNDGVLDVGEDRDGDLALDGDTNNDGILDVTLGPRWTQVPVIIPSFFRPQYMKSSTANGRPAVGSPNVPTDANWANAFDGFDRSTALYGTRSFRPHPSHLAGYGSDGSTPVFRFITASETGAAGVARPFPFIPEDLVSNTNNDPNVAGELGIWTGSDPAVYELDVDNDGDGIREGIWLDLNYPMQQTSETTPRNYVLLHSATIYDLDSLVNLNVHGNLAGLTRGPTLQQLTDAANADSLEFKSIAQSNLGLGPNEINPIHALRRDTSTFTVSGGGTRKATTRGEYQGQFTAADAVQFLNNVGDVPDTDIEQANIELLWLLTGRLTYAADGSITNLQSGRYGDDQWVYNAIHTIGADNGGFVAADLPRAGRSGNSYEVVTSGPRFGGDFATGGRNGFDDNQDRFEGEINLDAGRVRPFGQPMDYSGAGRSTTSDVTAYDIATRQFTTTGDATSPDLYQQTAPIGPSRWTRYTGYTLVRDLADANRYIFGINKISNDGTDDDLLQNPFFDALLDDPLETVFDIDFDVRPFDNIFGPQDIFELQLDVSLTANPVDTLGSRMSSLAPFALSGASNPGFDTDAVRDRFTTYSYTTRYGALRHPFGADSLPGLAGVDDDNDNTVDEFDEIFTFADTTENLARSWEFSADTNGADRDGDGYGDGNGRFEFPPAFGVQPYRQSSPFAGTQINDPFRPQVRRLLTIEAGASADLAGQLPISVNHIIDVERGAQTPAEGSVEFLQYMQQTGLRFRSLTDHPDASETDVLTTTTVPTLDSILTNELPAFPPQTVGQREFWARRDRQQMARDIYVLLYTVGGATLNASLDGIADYTATNADTSGVRPLYTDAQLRRMAQFAVNLVDAMDTDNVSTKFEYDKDLGNGWGLDDDPFTTGDSAANDAANGDQTAGNQYAEDAGDRGVVFGIEGQQLAFSEILAVRSPDFAASGAPESDLTQHIDDHGDATDLKDTFFLHIELQNMLPTTLALATTETGTANEDFGIWRISRFDRADLNDAQAAPDQTMTLMEGNDDLAGGDLLTITAAGRDGAGTDPTGWGVSDLYVDSDETVPGDTFDLISPDIDTVAPISATPPAPLADLDLIFSGHDTRYVVSGDTSKTGIDFLETTGNYRGNDAYDYDDPGAGVVTGFELVLQRRANPNMPQLPLADNPWVNVDRVPVGYKDLFTFSVDSMTGDAVANLNLGAINSAERVEPLVNAIRDVRIHGAYTAANDPNPDPNRRNTIGSTVNSATNAIGGSFRVTQPHYDRDFASVGELLNLPVVGPELFTQAFEAMHRSPYQQVTNGGAIDQANVVGAAAMFLRPDIDVETASSNVALSSVDNRWYRLLQFVEVPSRVHRTFGNYLNLTRLPGKMNMNMFRHMEVYASLIDDPMFADIADATRNDSPFLDGDVTGALTRDRWREYLQERDGRPVTSYGTTGTVGSYQYTMPGTPNARPFRSLGYTSGALNDNGLENTLLRRLATDRDDDGNGTDDDETGGTANTTNRNWLEVGPQSLHSGVVSPQQRHQILSKLINNTTTVSNTFIVYATAGYFEASETSEGLVRVGGRIDLDNPADNGNLTVDTGEDHTSGWETKSVFVIDRSAFLEAYDSGTGSFDWNALVKARFDIQ